ncbi:hypothetical protein MMEU_2452 [Mycobacterium marinum str. Europe]|nr:hypothetical protein MMEU_2452 [Mycobacterium marinum str. Europe]
MVRGSAVQRAVAEAAGSVAWAAPVGSVRVGVLRPVPTVRPVRPATRATPARPADRGENASPSVGRSGNNQRVAPVALN